MSSFIVLVWLSGIAVHDRRTGRIPNSAVWPGVLAPVAMAAHDPAILASAGVAAVPYVVAAVAGLGGGGDIKLAFALGGLLADPAVALLVILLAAILGAAGHALARSRGPRPHAPALVAAAICGLALT
ncbi:prepilin peptidase [Gordonia sp. PKS22-38]|uniref:Prepilin peptidase n=1 Tax=Gordonia prachuapensis TaxID=3115651 RepID=A0ABU7MT23_9ACTN|nr:prepilin peptidase [Gordonia sp. PKS22-38]